MPYIKQEERGGFVEIKRIPQTAGQLNYLITSLCLAYLREHGPLDGEGQPVPTYDLLNEVVGALESAKLEFYRRQVAPVEDFKSQRNGDIPWLRLSQ